MKTVIWLPIACLVGVIIGAWGPREEMRALLEKSDEQRQQPKNAAAEGFQAFARLANIPAEARRSHRRRPGAQPLFAAATNKPPPQAAIATNVPAPSVARAAVTNQPPRLRERRRLRRPCRGRRSRGRRRRMRWSARWTARTAMLAP